MAIDMLERVMRGITLRSNKAFGVAVEQLQKKMEEWAGKIPVDATSSNEAEIRILIQEALRLEEAHTRLSDNAEEIGIKFNEYPTWFSMSEGIATDMVSFAQALCEHLKLSNFEDLLQQYLADAGLRKERE